MSTSNYVQQAELVMAEGRTAVGKARAHNEAGDTATADAYGQKAHGCWMQAQALATLALVEEQRTANLIAVVHFDIASGLTPKGKTLDLIEERLS